MEDENADRVYVPGTNPTPPARDVEPFWPPEELEAPVHGGRPVPHEPPPAMPLPPPSAPVPPVPPVPSTPVPSTPVPPTPVPSAPVSASPNGPAASDSPWAQPPQRPTAQPGDDGNAGIRPMGGRDRGAGVAPPPRSSEADSPARPDASRRAAYYPTVTPRQSPENGTARNNGDGPHDGPVYRPGPHPPPPGPHPSSPRPQPPPPGSHPSSAGPHPSSPGPQPPFPGPHPDQASPNDPYQQLPWVSDGTPTAEEFARRRLAKPAEPTATMGARALVQKGTMGLVRLAPGKYEREYKQDVEMVRRNFGGLRQVTVVNPKGGAGKTVAVLLLAMTFGQKRGGYVLAWDNNETQGTLGMRAQQDFHARTVRDMMRDLHLFRGSHGRVGDLSQYVRAQGEGMFDVLASDESATAGEMLTASAFAEIREIVSRFYKLIFVDTGNNVRAQNWQAAMDATDQLVITMSARNDSAETAARMLDHLEQSGRQRLVRQAISVVTMPPTRKGHRPAGDPTAFRRADPGGAAGALREADRLGRADPLRPTVERHQGQLAQDRRSRRRRPIDEGRWMTAQVSASAAVGSLSRRNWAHRAASSDSPIAAAAMDKLCKHRRKPWFGACDQGIGPWPFQPFRRSASRPR